MKILLHRFKQDENGTSAIEFAFIAPMLLWILMAMIEYGIIFHIQSLSTHAAGEAARRGKTGNSYQTSVSGASNTAICANFDSNNRPAMVRCVAEYYLAPWLGNGNSLQVGSDVAGTVINGINTPDALVLYQVVYKWNVITPLLTPLFNGTAPSSSSINIVSYALIKNERF